MGRQRLLVIAVFLATVITRRRFSGYGGIKLGAIMPHAGLEVLSIIYISITIRYYFVSDLLPSPLKREREKRH